MYVRVSCPVWCIVNNDNNNLHILFVSPIKTVCRNTILKWALLPFQALHFQIMAIQAKKLSAAHFANIPNISQNRHTEQSLHRQKTSSYPGQMHEIFVTKQFAHWQGGSSAPKSLEVCTRLKDNIQTLSICLMLQNTLIWRSTLDDMFLSLYHGPESRETTILNIW